jgi:hypothetical protein
MIGAGFSFLPSFYFSSSSGGIYPRGVQKTPGDAGGIISEIFFFLEGGLHPGGIQYTLGRSITGLSCSPIIFFSFCPGLFFLCRCCYYCGIVEGCCCINASLSRSCFHCFGFCLALIRFKAYASLP